MAEYYYAFIKNNRVQEIFTFAAQDEEFADRVAQEKGFDDAVWVGENCPSRWSTYDGSTFIPPTRDFLYSIGIVDTDEATYQAEIDKIRATLTE